MIEVHRLKRLLFRKVAAEMRPPFLSTSDFHLVCNTKISADLNFYCRLYYNSGMFFVTLQQILKHIAL